MVADICLCIAIVLLVWKTVQMSHGMKIITEEISNLEEHTRCLNNELHSQNRKKPSNRTMFDK